MAIHSINLAWRIPGTEEPGGLHSIALQRVRHSLATYHEHVYYFKNYRKHANYDYILVCQLVLIFESVYVCIV